MHAALPFAMKGHVHLAQSAELGFDRPRGLVEAAGCVIGSGLPLPVGESLIGNEHDPMRAAAEDMNPIAIGCRQAEAAGQANVSRTALAECRARE